MRRHCTWGCSVEEEKTFKAEAGRTRTREEENALKEEGRVKETSFGKEAACTPVPLRTADCSSKRGGRTADAIGCRKPGCLGDAENDAGRSAGTDAEIDEEDGALLRLLPGKALAGRRAFLAGLLGFCLVPSLPSLAYGRTGQSARTRRLAALIRCALGKPYRWGAQGPDAFDCSGLMVWLFGHLGLRLPRQAVEQGRCGRKVQDRLKPGDVLLFRSAASPSGWHIGMYIGRTFFVHASGKKRGVILSSLREKNYLSKVAAVRRYLA